MNKCPVCGSKIDSSCKCKDCGFNDIRKEFINDEERIFWQTYVVNPCKYAYELNRTLQTEVDKLRKEIIKLTFKNMKSNQNIDAPKVPLQSLIDMEDGWNYNDPIAHPNSAECTYYTIKSRVYNIKVEMTSSTTATISFIVQKTKDSKGKNSTEMLCVRYRVKDSDGIIVLNKVHHVNGLQVGDASRETIMLNGLTGGRYSIDFVDY